MKKIYSLFASCFFVCQALAQQPIQLGNINMPTGGDTLRYSNTQLASIGDYTQTGTNFHWDFSNLVFTSQGVRDFKVSSQTPYSFFFLSSGGYGEKVADTINLQVVKFTNVYSFYKKQTSPGAFVADGSGMTFSSIPVPSYYSDKDELYNFPMTFPKHDSTTFKFSTPNSTMIPMAYSKQGYRITDVDGWGTITTPYGTANCLRLVTTQYSQDTIKISSNLLPFPLPPIGIPNYQRSYQWMTLSSKIPFLEVTGNLVGNNFAPTTVRYRDSVRSLTPQVDVGIEKYKDISGLELYPNPVTDKLWLSFSNSNKYEVEIYSTGGKLLKTQQSEAFGDKQFINVENFPTGLYVIKLSQQQKQGYFKFIKE